ncbi:MAG: class I SAM-dependent methyltransferase [Candidatus Kaiserbacteria bacterium]|nr:class I SAM-dependent methyltransferase [Candidatus Kaiserbacteria bacterium]
MSFAPKYHEWILREFSPHIGKKVAEVGAGSGTFSELLLRLPIDELLVVEPSKEMFPLLAERVGRDPHVTCAQAFFQDISGQYAEHFDTVLYVNVLEHIKDDEKELRHAYESLKAGGTLCVFVPALQWLFGEHDRIVGHQRRYYKKQLTSILEASGFEIVAVRYFDIAGVLPWWLLMRLMKRQLSDGNAMLYDSFVVPIMSWIESIVHPPIGKNLIAVVRKRG